jgi:5-methylcytosine-specific restriction endonuclease McrA
MDQTLVLTSGYEPIKVVSWQRAITLLTLGKVEVIEEYDRDIRSPTLVFKMPAVVRLLRAFRRSKGKVKFSRVNIYARDKYRCQYCAQKLPIAELTYDHVLPRSLGGKTTWQNIVAACAPCNARKSDRTPQQAGMRLITKPVRPKWVPVMTLRLSKNTAPEAWRDYLYWTAELNA